MMSSGSMSGMWDGLKSYAVMKWSDSLSKLSLGLQCWINSSNHILVLNWQDESKNGR
jgi:hypothetical protein